MDPLTQARTGAETAGADVAKLQESIPGLLSGFKQNLTNIFTKNNPLFADRENALTTFLNQPSQTRAGLLGSGLSPTQQNAIVEARRNAALIPLAGLNQQIVGQYGNIADMLGRARDIYSSQIEAGKTRQAGAQQQYKNIFDELVQKEKIRQFNVEETRKGKETKKTVTDEEQEAADWADAINNGTATLTNVPVKLRTKVIQYMNQITTETQQQTQIPQPSSGLLGNIPERFNPISQFGALFDLIGQGISSRFGGK